MAPVSFFLRKTLYREIKTVIRNLYGIIFFCCKNPIRKQKLDFGKLSRKSDIRGLPGPRPPPHKAHPPLPSSILATNLIRNLYVLQRCWRADALGFWTKPSSLLDPVCCKHHCKSGTQTKHAYDTQDIIAANEAKRQEEGLVAYSQHCAKVHKWRFFHKRRGGRNTWLEHCP